MGVPWPKPNERACFVGPTRCGKTQLAKRLLVHYRNVIAVDPKHQFSWDLESNPRFRRIAYSLGDLRTQLEDVEKTQTGEPIIYRPPPAHLLPANAHELDAIAKIAWDRGGTLLYYDELYFIASSSDFANRAPFFFYCVTAGGQKGIGVWSAFQRPAWVPIIATSETDYRFVFYLRLKADRDRAEDMCGDVPWSALQRVKHSFVWATDQELSTPQRLAL
jgi:hypothetical protein